MILWYSRKWMASCLLKIPSGNESHARKEEMIKWVFQTFAIDRDWINFPCNIIFQSQQIELPCDPYTTKKLSKFRFAHFYLQWTECDCVLWVFFESLKILFMLICVFKSSGFTLVTHTVSKREFSYSLVAGSISYFIDQLFHFIPFFSKLRKLGLEKR